MNAAGSLSPSPRTLEVESLDSFDRLVKAGVRTMHGWHAQSLDLRGRAAPLRTMDAQGAIFLGCTFDDGVEDTLRGRGALIFPRMESVPFNPYRGQLYTPQELYSGPPGEPTKPRWTPGSTSGASGPGSGTGWTPRWPRRCMTMSIGDALDELVRSELGGRSMVGVMGGHTAHRGTPAFTEAAVAGRLLARSGRVVATGGGPGAMEAANMGAYLSELPDADFHVALDRWQPFRGSGPPCPRGRGRRPPSSNVIRTERRRWGFPPGSMATSRPTTLPPTSRSTSPTPSGRPSCWSFATAV